MGLISYFCLLVVVFIALIIFDLLFYTTFSNDVCPPIEYTVDESTDEARLLEYELAAQTADETAADETAADEAQTSSSMFANKLVSYMDDRLQFLL
jgi:hypothetical protein